MQENEVIIVDGISNNDYDMLIEACVRYAIISLPFTVDRMSIPDEKQRALNIAKGKVAEALFTFFCNSNNINADFASCATPFWTVDNRDFLLNNNEWDIKNNFIYIPGELLQSDYINLPALIPNRFNGDQWGKRNQKLVGGSNRVEFLFTFLKNADLTNGQRGVEFLEITLSQEQHQFLRDLYAQYQGQLQNTQPFTEEWFWQQMEHKGSMNLYRLNFRPVLIITGYANENHWNLFRDTGPYDRTNNFQTYINPRWYTKSAKGSCNYLNGTLWTTITNSTLPISNLPSFLSLFPQLENNINNATIKG